MVSKAGRGNNSWLSVVVPYQIAYGPIGALVALYILHLGGGVIEVAYAYTLSNLVSIPAAILWSELVELANKRKVFIFFSFVALSLSLWALFTTRSVVGVIAIYGLLSFMVTANATPMNLLVMETNAERRWPDGFSRLQLLSSIGATIGFVFATIAATLLSLEYITLILLAFAILSTALTILLVRDPAVTLQRRAFVKYHESFRSRLMSHHLLFIRVPRLSTTREILGRLFTGKYRLSYMSVLFAALFVFYLGSSLFNTVYLAGFKARGISTSLIFLIVLFTSVVQTLAYAFAGRMTERSGMRSTAERYLFLRGVCYAGVGFGFVFLGTAGIFGVSMVLNAIAGGFAWALCNTAASTMVFEAIKDNRPARALGIYSSLVGIGTLIGSFAAGYLSYYIGYWFTFMLAGALVVLSAYIFFRIRS